MNLLAAVRQHIYAMSAVHKAFLFVVLSVNVRPALSNNELSDTC